MTNGIIYGIIVSETKKPRKLEIIIILLHILWKENNDEYSSNERCR